MERLRRQTAVDHDAVEGTVPLMVDDLNVDTYVLCLQRIYGVVVAWEEKAAGDSPEWMREVQEARERKEMLKRDLAWFGAVEPNGERPSLPEMKEEASMLGAMYVMEGSTLGGQLIARHVERVLGLSDGHGSEYFRGYGEQTGAMWKKFCQVLRTRVPDSETAAVVRTAKEMFAVFGSWMQRKTE